MTIYCKKITKQQRQWLENYEAQTGFEPMYQDDIDSGNKTFLQAAKDNNRWYEDYSEDVLRRITHDIPGEHDEDA